MHVQNCFKQYSELFIEKALSLRAEMYADHSNCQKLTHLKCAFS